MKLQKAIIILLVACFMLVFLGFQSLAQQSEETRFNFYQENYNYAKYWDSLSNNEKINFLLGVSAGIKKYDSDTKDFLHDNGNTLRVNSPSSEENDLVKVSKEEINLYGWQIFVSHGGYQAIIDRMNELYKDPANMHTPLIDVSFLSFHKIKTTQ